MTATSRAKLDHYQRQHVSISVRGSNGVMNRRDSINSMTVRASSASTNRLGSTSSYSVRQSEPVTTATTVAPCSRSQVEKPTVLVLVSLSDPYRRPPCFPSDVIMTELGLGDQSFESRIGASRRALQHDDFAVEVAGAKVHGIRPVGDFRHIRQGARAIRPAVN